MKCYITGFQLEQLERRSMLCAAVGAGVELPHHDDAALDEHVPAITVSENQAGNVVSSFARDDGAKVVFGDATIINGARVVTWALVSPHDNTILAVGATFSLKMAENMPESGPGPAGAFASLEFPAIVQDTTFFNHLEIQPEPDGHVTPPGAVNPNYYAVPHFDFHFYDMPEAQVRAIPAKAPPLTPVPANRLAPGYLPAGPSIAEMGRHSSPASVLTDTNPFTAVMVAGYLPDGSRLHFLEPMVSQEFLLQKQDFSLPVPMPQSLGRASPTLYPTRFEAVFQGNAYHLVFSDFVQTGTVASVNPASAGALAATAPSQALVNFMADEGDDPEDQSVVAEVLG